MSFLRTIQLWKQRNRNNTWKSIIFWGSALGRLFSNLASIPMYDHFDQWYIRFWSLLFIISKCQFTSTVGSECVHKKNITDQASAHCYFRQAINVCQYFNRAKIKSVFFNIIFRFNLVKKTLFGDLRLMHSVLVLLHVRTSRG